MATKRNKNHPAVSFREEPVQPQEAKSDDMRKDVLRRCDPARTLLIECLERVTCNDAGNYV